MTVPRDLVPPLPGGPPAGDKEWLNIVREMQRTSQQFEGEVHGIGAWLEFADEHGDRHMNAIRDLATPLIRRLLNYATLFALLSNDLEAVE